MGGVLRSCSKEHTSVQAVTLGSGPARDTLASMRFTSGYACTHETGIVVHTLGSVQSALHKDQ